MLLYFFAEFWSILSLSDNCSIGEDLSYWWKLGTKDVSFFCLQRFKERWEVPSSWIEVLLSQCGSVITLRRFFLFLYWCVSVSERMSLPNDHNFWFITFEHLALGTIDQCFDFNKYAFHIANSYALHKYFWKFSFTLCKSRKIQNYLYSSQLPGKFDVDN